MPSHASLARLAAWSARRSEERTTPLSLRFTRNDEGA